MPRTKTILARIALWESGESRADVRRAMRLVRQNNDMAEVLAENVEYTYDHDGNRAATGPEGVFTDFLSWLLDHKDAIIALIKEIVALFMPAGMPEDVDGTTPVSARTVWENALAVVAGATGEAVKAEWTIAHVNALLIA